MWTKIVVGAEIPRTVDCGPGLRVRHWGRGVILHPDVHIGENADIFHRVTIGVSKGGVPTIGDNVYIGTGATIIGGIDIGDNVSIGAGAVVVSNVPSGESVGGVPARVLRRKTPAAHA